MPDLEEEIKDAINRASRENNSDTPDFILARYLMRCLETFELTTDERETWHNRGSDDGK